MISGHDAFVLCARIAGRSALWESCLNEALGSIDSPTRVIDKCDRGALTMWGRHATGDLHDMICLGFGPSVVSQDCTPFASGTVSGDIVRGAFENTYGNDWHTKVVLYNYMPTLAFQRHGRDWNFDLVAEELGHHDVMRRLRLELDGLLNDLVIFKSQGMAASHDLLILCCGNAPHRWARENVTYWSLQDVPP